MQQQIYLQGIGLLVSKLCHPAKLRLSNRAGRLCLFRIALILHQVIRLISGLVIAVVIQDPGCLIGRSTLWHLPLPLRYFLSLGHFLQRRAK